MGRLTGIAWREAKRAPMKTGDSAEISTAAGVIGDSRGKPGNRQVTVLSARAWREVCGELDESLPWTVRRANLLVDDLDLPRTAGAVIEIGDVRLQVTMEVEPCLRMDEQHAGLRAMLAPEWRGGVACSVLEGGRVSVGDAVTLAQSD